MVAVVILEDVAHLKEDVDPMVTDGVDFIRGPDNVSIMRRIIISLRIVGRSMVTLNRHNWLILTLLPMVVLFMLLDPLPLVLLALPLFCYHRMSMTDCVNSSFFQTSHSVTHAFSSDMNAYIASPQKPCILNSGAPSHITDIKQRFISLNLSNTYSSVKITNVTQSPVLGNGGSSGYYVFNTY